MNEGRTVLARTGAARRALLIDDEPLARLELRRLLAAHPQVEVVGEAGTMVDARALLGRTPCDLVFLDVQLRGGSGFDLLDSVPPGVQVVFVTAYDRFALRAFEVNALDYLLKPVLPARLAATLGRLGERREGEGPMVPPEPGRRLTIEDRVYVKTDGTTRFVPVASICAVRSAENYTELVLQDGPVLLVLRTLKSWEEALPAEHFVRIHRQALVNLTRVNRIERGEGDEMWFHLAVAVPPLAASRRAVSELRARFAAAGLEGLLP